MNNLKITLVFAVVISLTVSVMLSLVPLAPATASLQEDCEKSGGKWVVKGDNTFCYTTLEPEAWSRSRIEEVDSEFCGISTDSTPTPSACTPTEEPLILQWKGAGGGGGNESTSEVRMRIEEACVALQTGDTSRRDDGLELLNALVGSNGTQGGNITNATTNATTTTDTNNSNTTTNPTTPTTDEDGTDTTDTGTTTPTTPTTDKDGTDTTDTGTTAAQSPADSAQEGDRIPDCAPQAC